MKQNRTPNAQHTDHIIQPLLPTLKASILRRLYSASRSHTCSRCSFGWCRGTVSVHSIHTVQHYFKFESEARCVHQYQSTLFIHLYCIFHLMSIAASLLCHCSDALTYRTSRASYKLNSLTTELALLILIRSNACQLSTD